MSQQGGPPSTAKNN